jgi:DNA-binding IclR family transcriptional regulator
VPLVQIGEQLELYRALNDAGPSTVQEIAQSTGVAERYMREWLSAQTASNYISYDVDTEKFWMTPEQAFLLADRDSPFYLAPAFEAAATSQQNESQVREAFKTGAGIPLGEQTGVWGAVER